ncbi:hypothetical protein [Marinimicrobium sp. LS-A18]|uniref:hypothetical protein n=1 Tax=Marinimicrobium sp. LS-A18 TaxID=1381596 RepID=UPI0004641E35|nr:hypothetical protein [Marinimicrobium sp. LS-A18]
MFEVPKNLDTILHIGAGHCEELSAYLASDAKHIVLVEPNPGTAESLRQRTQGEARVEVLALAITDDPALNQLYEFNLPEAASLYRPTGLLKMYPGLRVSAQHSVATCTLEQLVNEHPLKGDRNLLVLQAPGAELTLIKSLIDTTNIEHFSHFWITCPHDAYYQASAPAEVLLVELKQHGYEVSAEGGLNSEWPKWQLTSNPLVRQLEAVKTEKQALSDALQARESELEYVHANLVSVKGELSEARKEFDRKQSEWDKQKQKLLKEEEQKSMETSELRHELDKERRSHAETREEVKKLMESLNEKNKKLAEAEGKLQTVVKQLDEQSAGVQRFEDLEAKLNALSGTITNHIDKKLLNTTKQIEGSMGLQQYLSSGELPLNYHGWPISPDLGLYLAEKIETQNFDLIIEFGSGTSTSLFAKTVMNKVWRSQSSGRKQALLERGHEEGYTKDLAFVEPAEEDLPKRVVTFEHKKEYYDKTANLLKQGGLGKVVDLVHAPLVDYEYKGESFLYYACDEKLSDLAKMLGGRRANILVLVDGPPGATGPLARFPALPKLLNALPLCRFDVILDDYNRKEEKDVANKWLEMLKSRGVSYSEERISLEKGAVCITVGNG